MALKRAALVSLGAVAVALVGARLALPTAIEWGINRALARNEKVSGSVGDVDLAIWRGAYSVQDLRLRDAAASGAPPFASVREIDLQIDMRQLLRRRLLGKGHLIEPVINLAALPEKEEAGEDAKDVKEAILPIEVSRVRVTSGTLVMPSPVEGAEDVRVDRIFVVADNIYSNEPDVEHAPGKSARVDGTARLPGDGALDLDVRFDPNADQPTFDLDLKLEGLALAELNPLLKPATGVDVNRGTGSVYAEVRAASGAFRGYVKPFLRDVEISAEGEEQKGFVETVKEGAAEIVKNVLKNEKTESVGARVPLSGSFEDPSVGVWTAIATTLRHAWVEALKPSLEDAV